jgi:hypothetical protein
LNKYRIQVSTDPTFVATPIWDSGASGTSMNPCIAGGRSPAITYGGSALALDTTKYYWRIKFWDTAGNEGAYSGGTDYFIMLSLNAPMSCNIKQSNDHTSITLTWADNSSDETQFRIEKNLDAGGFGFLFDAAADAISYLDSSVADGHTYQYRVRAEGPHNSDYCVTNTINLQTGAFNFGGINLKGLILR